MKKTLILAISVLAAHLSFTFEISEAKVTVSVSPGSADVVVNQTQQFTATVKGTKDTRVTWSVIAQGNDTFGPGSIDFTGLYTAPKIAPPLPLVTIRATSVVDPSASGTAQVIVRDTQDYTHSNADNDFDGINEGPFLSFTWSGLPDGTAKIVLSRSPNGSGPWIEVLISENASNLRPVQTIVYTDQALVPPDGANDYFYRLEAFSATGQLLKTYAPVFIPKVVVPLY